MKIYIVESFWYKDSDVRVFKTYEEAYYFMKQDWENALDDKDFTPIEIHYDETEFEGEFFCYGAEDGDGNDYSDLTFLTSNSAQLDAEGFDDKIYWKLWEREI